MARPKAPDMHEWICPGCGYQLQTVASIAPYHTPCGAKFIPAEGMTPLEIAHLKNQTPAKKGGRKR